MEEPNVLDTGTAQEPEKTFTQADVDALIAKRLERERKKYPSEDELAAYRMWREGQQTEKEKLDALTKDRDTARADLAKALKQVEQYEREKLLTGKGVPADDLDYYVFKIGKMVSDKKTFEQAADEFLAERKPSKVRVDMTASLDGGKPAASNNDTMNNIIRGAFK